MSDLPRYPEQFRGYPPVSEEALLAWLAPLGKEIIELTPPVFRELMKERIGWAASWFHLLPASGSFHHFEAGGLLRHSLECVAIFLPMLIVLISKLLFTILFVVKWNPFV